MPVDYHTHNGIDSPLVDPANRVVLPVSVPNGGTGQTTFTAHSVLLGNGAAGITSVGPATAGLVLTSNGGSADPTFQTAGVPAGLFGNAQDGSAIISGTTTLTRDMYYNNLTITTTGTLDVGGYRVFVKGTLTIQGNGKIAANGNNGGAGGNAGSPSFGAGGSGGTSGTAGAARPSGTLFGGNAGIAGGAGSAGANFGSGASNGGPGGNGTNRTGTINGNGTAGLGGGDGGASRQAARSGGTAGSVGSGTSIGVNPYDPWTASTMAGTFGDAIYQLKNTGQNSGSGGGAGGSDGNTSGAGGGGGGAGGGGSDGGNIAVFAYAIDLSTSTGNNFESKGGNGGNGGNATNGDLSNGAGGGGGSGGTSGNGGLIVVVYHSLTGSFSASVVAGTPGTKGLRGLGSGAGNFGVDGSNGNTGTAGLFISMQI